MNLLAYTMVVPSKKIGTYGLNASLINLLSKDLTGGFVHSTSASVVAFWTKPYQYSRKLTLSPQVFLMHNPISYNTLTKESGVNRVPSGLIGCSFDYKISKRFGFSLNYKANLNTSPEFRVLHNFLVGSRMIL
jgi:hypothetical protein